MADHQPVLTPYELEVMLKTTDWKDVYPMDYYSNEGGSWTNYGVKKAAAVASLPPPVPHCDAEAAAAIVGHSSCCAGGGCVTKTCCGGH